MGCSSSNEIKNEQKPGKTTEVTPENLVRPKNPILPDDIWKIALSWGNKHVLDLDLHLVTSANSNTGQFSNTTERCSWVVPLLNHSTTKT